VDVDTGQVDRIWVEFACGNDVFGFDDGGLPPPSAALGLKLRAAA
jgi:hypothetical protein